VPHGGMTDIDHGCRTCIEADPAPNIFRPFSEVLLH
jgi:hypothetical protein